MLRGISDCLSDESFSSEDFSTTKEINFVLPENRTRWQTDTKCAVCRINFNIPGVAHTEKDTCLFCYRGVCRRCLDSSKKHPESLKKEKICKLCIVEFRQIRFFSNKIEDSKLELSHLRLEVGMAVKENQEATQQRKYVQFSVENAKGIQNSSIAEKEVAIDEVKENLSKLSIRHDEGETKLRVWEERLIELKKQLAELNAKVKKWKNKILVKDEEENEIKREIENIKRKTIELLQKNQIDSDYIGEVVESLQKVARSLERYKRRVARKDSEISELEETLSKLRERNQEYEEEVDRLNKIIPHTSICEVPSNEMTSEEEEKLKSAETDLKNYDEIIEKLNARLEIMKKNVRKTNIATTNKYDKMLRQFEVLANVSHAKKNNLHRNPSNGEASCRKCIVS